MRLEQLFPGTPFLTEHYPARHLVAHGPLERLELPELTLETLLGAYRDQVRIALPDKRDEHSSLKVDAPTAATLHRNGMALIFNKVERFIPALAAWLNQLRLELGLPTECEPRCIMYATPPGAGNSPHFDANANFVVQLRGTKRWHVAPNRHVPNPTDRWAMNEEHLSAELTGYVDGPLPTELPEDTEVIDLKAGSVLFVPRGHWHATEADEDTLALNFTFGQPTWADLALVALRKRLLKDPAWRELASDEAQLGERLASLAAEVDALEPAEVMNALDDQPARYLLVPEGFLRIEGDVVLASVGAEEFELDADESLHAVLGWLGEQGSPFTAAEAALHFAELAPSLPGLLTTLESKGLLTRR